jgi:hypothetical protein
MSQHEGMTHQPYTDNDSGLVGARLAPSRQESVANRNDEQKKCAEY